MIAPSLYNFIKVEIQRMSKVSNQKKKGNIYPLIMEEVERCIISVALEETNYNYLATANILGISRSKLYRRIERLNIKR